MNLLKQVKKQNLTVLVHLGDIYYSGTQTEAGDNFLDIVRAVFGNTFPAYTLCGNHDMYSGGDGYYWLVDQPAQGASYFSLSNDNWQLLAMDTGHEDRSPMTVASNMTSVNDNEAAWLIAQISRNSKRKMVLLSHHQLFSSFSSVGRVDGKDYAYNPNLYSTFKGVLSKVEWWFWGHEHTLAIYDPYMGLRRGRCVGASAVPVFRDQQSYATAKGLATLDGNMPVWNARAQLSLNGDALYDNAFAVLELNAGSATAEYFRVPIDGEAASLVRETAG